MGGVGRVMSNMITQVLYDTQTLWKQEARSPFFVYCRGSLFNVKDYIYTRSSDASTPPTPKHL